MRIEKVLLNFLIIISCLLLLLSCSTGHYFKTPNDLNKMNGSIIMEDGTERKGSITILFENGAKGNSEAVQFIPANSSKEELIKIAAIQYYSINGNSYYPKYLNLYTAGTNHLLFVKRLSPANSKIQLFELHQTYKSSSNGEETTYHFISFPGSKKYETIEITSDKLVPNFELKMSAFVADCLDLAQKIKAKKNGYSYSMVSFGPKKLDVIKNIISEYNFCK